jgi:hypothetical protein
MKLADLAAFDELYFLLEILFKITFKYIWTKIKINFGHGHIY